MDPSDDIFVSSATSVFIVSVISCFSGSSDAFKGDQYYSLLEQRVL